MPPADGALSSFRMTGSIIPLAFGLAEFQERSQVVFIRQMFVAAGNHGSRLKSRPFRNWAPQARAFCRIVFLLADDDPCKAARSRTNGDQATAEHGRRPRLLLNLTRVSSAPGDFPSGFPQANAGPFGQHSPASTTRE